jgi:hypothetical protein
MSLLQVVTAVLGTNEAGVDDDAVGIVGTQHPFVGGSHVGLHPEAPAQAFGHGVDLVDGALPAQHPQPGLLGHLAGQPLEQGLAVVDHPARWAPVEAAVASPVPDQQQPVRALQQTPGHGPVPHRPPVWHRRRQ